MKDANYTQILGALRRIIRATDRYSRYLNKTTGLTAAQLVIMQALREAGEATMGSIAREVNLSQATVTTILDRLERRGLIRRTRGQTDKRRVYASLSESGLALVRESPIPLQEHFVQQLQKLRDWERSMILSSLQRIAELMDPDQIAGFPPAGMEAALEDRPEHGADDPLIGETF